MPLLVSPTINDIYTGYVFKIITQTNKILIGCKCLVPKNLKAKTTNNEVCFQETFHDRYARMECVSVQGELD